MALNAQTLQDAPIIELDSIDSTNNYAMRLIDADTAQPGLTIVARQQTHGKGQRGRQWEDNAGDSLLMSILVNPEHRLEQQFLFNAAAAVAIANVFTALHENWNICIKWPNDIIVNDKKAAGVLIENVLRGSHWVYSIIGLGMNVLQTTMPLELPYATSLHIASGKRFVINELCLLLRKAILTAIYGADKAEILRSYNEYLYRREEKQRFNAGDAEWEGIIKEVNEEGKLVVEMNDGGLVQYTHGAVNWKWE